MAKLSFNKLGIVKNNSIKTVEYNGQNIEIKQYMPINDKIALVSTILNYTLNNGENRFANPIQVEVFMVLECINKYTNITFTDKQREDPAKLYDLIVSSGLWDLIMDNFNKEDYALLLNLLDETIESYYSYHNSVFGIIESINNDYQEMNLEATDIQEKLADPNNMALLKEILTKLG